MGAIWEAVTIVLVIIEEMKVRIENIFKNSEGLGICTETGKIKKTAKISKVKNEGI